MESGGGYHVHDEGNEIGWQLEEDKRFLDKILLKMVIGFFKIQFDCDVSSSTSPISSNANNVLNQNNIVTGPAPRHKSSLTRINDFCHIGFEALHKDSRYQLVKSVA